MAAPGQGDVVMSRTYRYRLCSCPRCEGHSSRWDRRQADRRVRHELASGLDLPDGNAFRRLGWCEHGESRWPFGGVAAQAAVYHDPRRVFSADALWHSAEWLDGYLSGDGGGLECDTRHFRVRRRFGGAFRRDRRRLASGTWPREDVSGPCYH